MFSIVNKKMTLYKEGSSDMLYFSHLVGFVEISKCHDTATKRPKDGQAVQQTCRRWLRFSSGILQVDRLASLPYAHPVPHGKRPVRHLPP